MKDLDGMLLFASPGVSSIEWATRFCVGTAWEVLRMPAGSGQKACPPLDNVFGDIPSASSSELPKASEFLREPRASMNRCLIFVSNGFVVFNVCVFWSRTWITSGALVVQAGLCRFFDGTSTFRAVPL